MARAPVLTSPPAMPKVAPAAAIVATPGVVVPLARAVARALVPCGRHDTMLLLFEPITRGLRTRGATMRGGPRPLFDDMRRGRRPVRGKLGASLAGAALCLLFGWIYLSGNGSARDEGPTTTTTHSTRWRRPDARPHRRHRRSDPWLLRRRRPRRGWGPTHARTGPLPSAPSRGCRARGGKRRNRETRGRRSARVVREGRHVHAGR